MSTRTPVGRVYWSVAGILGVLLVAVNLVMATRGLDRTDEGMYLNAISRPDDDLATVLLFGYVYHPVYALFGGDIVQLRWFGILATVGLGFIATWTFLGLPRLVGPVQRSGGLRAVVSIAVAAAGTFMYLALPLSPGYNSLNLQALLLVATGLSLAMFGNGRQPLAGWGLVGVGGLLTFLSKPTSAAALAALVLVLVLANLGRWARLLPVAVLTCALACAPLALSTPVTGLIERMTAGAEASRLRGSHDRLLRWDTLPLDRAFDVPALAVLLLVAVHVALAHLGAPSWLVRAPLVAAFGTAALATLWWVRTDQTTIVAVHGPTSMIGLVLLTLLALLPRGGAAVEHPNGAAAGRRTVASFVVFVAMLPAVGAIGSNNNLWMVQGRMTVFWVLAATIVLVRRSLILAVAPALTAGILLSAYVVGAVLSPYRYPSLLAADTPVQATADGGTIRLTPEDARHSAELLALGARLGIDGDTWIVDLTGESPGYIHALNARSVGQAWVLGGYRRSEQAAVYVMQLDPCVLREALVLDDPKGDRRLDPSVMKAMGLTLEEDYTVVGDFRRLDYVSDEPAHFSTVTILRPRPGLTVTGCPNRR